MLSFANDEAAIACIRKLFFGFGCISGQAKMLDIKRLFEWWCMQPSVDYTDQQMRFPFCLWDRVTYKHNNMVMSLFDNCDIMNPDTVFTQLCCDLTEELYMTKRAENWDEMQAFRYSIGSVTREIEKKL